MELVQLYRRQTQQQRSAIHLPISVYQRHVLRLLLGVMFILISVTALTRLMQPPSNPFAAYDDLIAGDALDPAFGANYETLSRAAFDLACATTLIERYCVYKPFNGPFAAVRFMNLNDEGDRGIYFLVRDNALTVGDVARLWGRPIIERHENSLVLHWPDQRMSTVVRSESGQFNYFLPVSHLLLRS